MEQFLDKLAAKLYKAFKRDKEQEMAQLSDKLDQLKPLEKVKVQIEGAEILTIKGEKGEKGDTGDQGEQGIQGQKGDTGKDSTVPGPQGEKGESIVGPEGPIGPIGPQGEPGESITGPPGKDGSPDTAEQIVEKLSTIKQAWLELSQIKGLQDTLQAMGNDWLNQAKGFVPRTLDSLYDVQVRGVISDGQILIWNAATQKWKPGTATATGGGSLAVETPSGTLNGVNVTFTVSNTPVFITLNGQVLTGSGVDFTYAGGTITLVNAPFSTDILRSYHN